MHIKKDMGISKTTNLFANIILSICFTNSRVMSHGSLRCHFIKKKIMLNLPKPVKIWKNVTDTLSVILFYGIKPTCFMCFGNTCSVKSTSNPLSNCLISYFDICRTLSAQLIKIQMGGLTMTWNTYMPAFWSAFSQNLV